MLIVANGQNLEIEEGKRFTCLVHQQGIRVDVPEAVEINARTTIACMEKMSQRAWEHISRGEIFRILFSTVFPREDYGQYPSAEVETDGEHFPKPPTRFTVQVPSDTQEGKTVPMELDLEPGIPIPATIEELNKGDFGVIHAAGMIVQGCEALFEGKTKVFFRNPEDNLHPKAERRIIDMFKKMMLLAGATGTVTEEAPSLGGIAREAGGVLKNDDKDVGK